MGTSWAEVSEPSALNQWEIKEQLFLASVIRKQGQERIRWKEASKRMDVLCDREFGWRPWDWYSPKNCKAQYNHMLDTVVGSRKDSMLSSGRDKDIANAIYDHYAEKRKAELNSLIYGNQVWYKEKFFDVKQAMNSGELTEAKLWELYNELKQKDESIRLEKMRKENQRRERKRMREIHDSWESLEEAGEVQNSTSVEVREIFSNGRPVLGSSSAASPVQQVAHQTSTSPLLSSLLKSPTSSNAGINSVRAAAPTITSLLTSGSMPRPVQAASIPNLNIPPKHAVQMLTNATSPQNLLSPSKSAPTLSMLLEKSKSPKQLNEPLPAISSKDAIHSQQPTINECNNEEVPMDIEEDATDAKEDTKLSSTDSDEHDANEEQQLLEIFKNIGNMDELDIDVSDVINEEVDFLKVDAAHPTKAITSADLEVKLRSYAVDNADYAKESEKQIEDKFSKSSDDKPAAYQSNKKDVFEFSDDSSDNIPLATVAYFGCKEISPAPEAAADETNAKQRLKGGANVLTVSPVEVQDEGNPEKATEKPIAVPDSNETAVKSTIAEDITAAICTPADNCNVASAKGLVEEKLKPSLDSKVPVEEAALEIEKAALMTSLEAEAIAPEADDSMLEAVKSVSPMPVADTDEDSCATDASNYTKHEDKHAKHAPTPQQLRKRETETGVRAHALRKLRDRDRSESPLTVSESAALGKKRYSSTQAIDAIAGSPISWERDTKRTLLTLYRALQPAKYAAFFARIRDEPGYDEICRRPMDFQLMKKGIETGAIQSVSELKNAALVMAYNAASVSQKQAEKYNTILEFMREIHELSDAKENEDEKTKKPKETKDKPSGKRGRKRNNN